MRNMKNQAKPHGRRSEEEQLEKIKTCVFPSSVEATKALAQEVLTLLREKEKEGKSLVLGLATGSTPVPFYRELIRSHRQEGVSFKNMITFNLDEYYPISRDHRESYYQFMQNQFFKHIDIPVENVHIPDGSMGREQVFAACQAYEEAIEKAGGIDLQVLGIGNTGHIGFNEPGSSRDSVTRLITLDRITRQDAARDFLGLENVPSFALTMGVGTILRARRIVLMAWGEKKAAIVARAVEGPVSDAVSASFLQEHPHAGFYIDEAAASELSRKKFPWLVGSISWTPSLSRCAVNWLSTRLEKPVLKLVDEDYNENGLSELVTEQGPAYTLNIRIFNEIQHTITGWPGGKPEADDSNRPEKALPYPKKVAVFSPEPFADVFAMGGTINRLVSQGNDVHLIYQASGNLGVPDGEVEKFLRVLQDIAGPNSKDWEKQREFADHLLRMLKGKSQSEPDSQPIREIKGLLRREEARESALILGIIAARIYFQDLLFYEKGRYRQFRPEPADVDKTFKLLVDLQPHQIYLTGKVADPSSVEYNCFRVLELALESLQKEDWLKKCSFWLYRVHEKELEPHKIDMAVPLSPDQLSLKMRAIHQHQSQSTQVLISEDRNREMARLYDHFGLAEYEAIEVFQRWRLFQ